MKNNFFEELVQLTADYIATRAAISASDKEAGQIVQAVQERWKAEESRRKARADELDEIIKDMDKPAAVRKMAQAELEELGRYQRTVLYAEAEAFSEAMADAEEALSELRGMYAELRKKFDDVNNVVQGMRKETVYGWPTLDQLGTWISNTKADFQKIGGCIVEVDE